MKTFVVIPTYNEAENIESLIKEILNLNLDIHIVVVDDDSPDGTWKIVKNMVEQFDNIHCLRRCGNRGRGTAGVEGFKYALTQGAEYIIEMDADFSHNPAYIPVMLEKMKYYDVILGSRFIKNGKDERGIIRHMITILANMYIKLILNINNIYDCTSGFRCFKREVLEKIDLNNTISTGPAIVQELLYKAYIGGFNIGEVPIKFVDRTRGKSTFNFKIMIQGIIMVPIFKYLFSHKNFLYKNNCKTIIYSKHN